jgi:hypothetical protein
VRSAKLFALYVICSRWHTGQWSRGYRLLCRSGGLLHKIGIRNPLDQIKLARSPRKFRGDFFRFYRKFYKLRNTL